jgi:hypothetical protein
MADPAGSYQNNIQVFEIKAIPQHMKIFVHTGHKGRRKFKLEREKRIRNQYIVSCHQKEFKSWKVFKNITGKSFP